jgi:hypothetical protein
VPRKPVLRDACAKVGLATSTYWKRRRSGMSHEEALTMPVLPSRARAAACRASIDRRMQEEADHEFNVRLVNKMLRSWRLTRDP